MKSYYIKGFYGCKVTESGYDMVLLVKMDVALSLSTNVDSMILNAQKVKRNYTNRTMLECLEQELTFYDVKYKKMEW